MSTSRVHLLPSISAHHFFPTRITNPKPPTILPFRCSAFNGKARESREIFQDGQRTDHTDITWLVYLQDGRRGRRGLGTSHEKFKPEHTELSLTHEKHSGFQVAIQVGTKKWTRHGRTDPWSRQIEPYFRKIGGPRSKKHGQAASDG